MNTKRTVVEELYTRSVRQLAVVGIAAFAGAKALAAGSITIDSDLSPMLSKSEVLAHVDLNLPVNTVFVLPLKDPVGAESYAMRVNTPVTRFISNTSHPRSSELSLVRAKQIMTQF
jgi:hypothetical protein